MEATLISSLGGGAGPRRRWLDMGAQRPYADVPLANTQFANMLHSGQSRWCNTTRPGCLTLSLRYVSDIIPPPLLGPRKDLPKVAAGVFNPQAGGIWAHLLRWILAFQSRIRMAQQSLPEIVDAVVEMRHHLPVDGYLLRRNFVKVFLKHVLQTPWSVRRCGRHGAQRLTY